MHYLIIKIQWSYKAKYFSLLDDTYFFENNSKKWKRGPDMKVKRSHHACGAFLHPQSLTKVFVVAGGDGKKKSAEFLTQNGKNWEAGMFSKSCFSSIKEKVFKNYFQALIYQWSSMNMDKMVCLTEKTFSFLTLIKMLSCAWIVTQALVHYVVNGQNYNKNFNGHELMLLHF